MQAGLELWARPAGAGHVLLASPLKRTQDNASRPSRACRTLGRFRTRLCNRRIDKEDRRSDAARLFLRRNRVFGTHTHSNLGSPKGTAAKVNCEERRDFRRPSSPGVFQVVARVSLGHLRDDAVARRLLWAVVRRDVPGRAGMVDLAMG
jgi:hypothetical protein